MKTKMHVFTLTVHGARTKRSAELAVLSAFAQRQPDGCKFHLNNKHRDAWMAGSMSGVQLGFELSIRTLEAQMKRLKLKAPKK